MPAVGALKKADPGCEITVLSPRGLGELWEMFEAADRIITLDKTLHGTVSAARKLRELAIDLAYILPNSFRSALIPYAAGVSRRLGAAGHNRKWMLTDVVHPGEGSFHQSLEYFCITGVPAPSGIPGPPSLAIPGEAQKKATGLLAGSNRPRIGFMPGAAFGAAKRWPVEYWIDVGKDIAGKGSLDTVIFGLSSEISLCRHIAGEVDGAVDLSGRTSLAELAAAMRSCRVIVCNDSGGMHLAAAMGVPVVAVFGMTDPAKTSPLGEGHTILAAEDVEHRRDIRKDSAGAVAAMRSVRPERVLTAIRRYLPAQIAD
jgi:heptosyltransferase-2